MMARLVVTVLFISRKLNSGTNVNLYFQNLLHKMIKLS